MKNFNKGNRFKDDRGGKDFKRGGFKGKDFGGGGGFGGGRGFGGGGFGGKREMFQATCSKCGKPCEVPFRPTGERPVFCKNCFERPERPDNMFSGRPQGNSFGRPRFDEKRMYEASCSKCHNRCEVPFRPTGEKPVYCSNCFVKDGSAPSNKSSEPSKGQFEMLNAKLDKILKLLTPAQATEVKAKESKPAVLEEPKKAKPEKVKEKAASKKAKAKKK